MKSSLTTVPAAAVDSSLAVPVTDADGDFAGTFTPTRFAARNGSLLAAGKLEGTLGGAAVVEEVTIPVVEIGGSCPELQLALGPAEVDLSGAPTRLERTVLTVEGTPGILGNLVCAVTHLRDSGTGLALVPDLLNQILARM
ncbi:MAG: hypothetical protein M3540_11965 [Actinomycetota bacterium]|nr:hypothetical protein [Actinomycetota bacterium]